MNQRPQVIMFDVNETLSDTTALAHGFDKIGAPGHLAETWFAQVLRDGFALTSTGDNVPFATIAATLLETVLGPDAAARLSEDAEHDLLASFARLPLHPDVREGLTDLSRAGRSLVSLSNGAAPVARSLLEAAGLVDLFELVLSVEDAPRWKPGEESYRWAAQQCDVAPAEVMLVAVHPWDIHGAARAGLRTAWINRGQQAYPSYFTEPELSVPSVTDLARRLG